MASTPCLARFATAGCSFLSRACNRDAGTVNLPDLGAKLDDSLDDHIPSNRFFYDYDVAINSRLSLSEIETQSHPDRNFNIQGHLIYNEAAYYLTGDGVLEHIEGGEALACLLTMNIKLMEGTTLVLDNYGQVEDIFLLQTVLNQEVLDEWGKVGY